MERVTKLPGYAYVWAFTLRAESRQEFEEHYGPEGTWARLFRQSEGYIETLLLHDRNDPLKYLTVDRWRSRQDYEEFRRRFAADYDELDRRCENLTAHEERLGEFFE